MLGFEFIFPTLLLEWETHFSNHELRPMTYLSIMIILLKNDLFHQYDFPFLPLWRFDFSLCYLIFIFFLYETEILVCGVFPAYISKHKYANTTNSIQLSLMKCHYVSQCVQNVVILFSYSSTVTFHKYDYF